VGVNLRQKYVEFGFKKGSKLGKVNLTDVGHVVAKLVNINNNVVDKLLDL